MQHKKPEFSGREMYVHIRITYVLHPGKGATEFEGANLQGEAAAAATTARIIN